MAQVQAHAEASAMEEVVSSSCFESSNVAAGARTVRMTNGLECVNPIVTSSLALAPAHVLL